MHARLERGTQTHPRSGREKAVKFSIRSIQGCTRVEVFFLFRMHSQRARDMYLSTQYVAIHLDHDLLIARPGARAYA